MTGPARLTRIVDLTAKREQQIEAEPLNDGPDGWWVNWVTPEFGHVMYGDRWITICGKRADWAGWRCGGFVGLTKVEAMRAFEDAWAPIIAANLAAGRDPLYRTKAQNRALQRGRTA